jgi:ABC-type Mn2+/Zn2+ transport system permease subunit
MEVVNREKFLLSSLDRAVAKYAGFNKRTIRIAMVVIAIIFVAIINALGGSQ